MTLRRTGIKRGTSHLKRSAKLKSTGLIGREKALKPVRRSMSPEEKFGKDTVDARATVGEYVLCEIVLPGCVRYGSDWHHRRNKGQGGPWDPANGLKVCRRCHDQVTDTDPEWNYNGWWLVYGENPLTKPVLRRGEWVLLDNVGGSVPCPAPKRPVVAS